MFIWDRGSGLASADVLGLTHVNEEVVLLTSIHKVLSQSPVLQVAVIGDEAEKYNPQ